MTEMSPRTIVFATLVFGLTLAREPAQGAAITEGTIPGTSMPCVLVDRGESSAGDIFGSATFDNNIWTRIAASPEFLSFGNLQMLSVTTLAPVPSAGTAVLDPTETLRVYTGAPNAGTSNTLTSFTPAADNSYGGAEGYSASTGFDLAGIVPILSTVILLAGGLGIFYLRRAIATSGSRR